ncbi:hypothetical protein NADFUDRAFT_9032, partial [Nadsonia fulvescens var. elongata DSM 6958]
YQEFDTEAAPANEFQRKKSLIRPERSRIDPDHRNYHYTQLAAQQADRINVMPSSTGNDPILQEENILYEQPETGDLNDSNIYQNDEARDGTYNDREEDYELKGGRAVYGLNDEPEAIATSPAIPLKQDPSLNKTGSPANVILPAVQTKPVQPAGPVPSLWMTYCNIVTFWAPAPLLKLCGMPKKERQSAWREKIGLITVILYVAAFVAYLTFGFTKTVCNKTVDPPKYLDVKNDYLIINGKAASLGNSYHPTAIGVPASNVLYPPVNAGGMDASLLFQNVNGNCKGLIEPKDNCSIPRNGNEVAWYMPCRLLPQDGSAKPNFTVEYYAGWACHTSDPARNAYYGLEYTADVFFTWDDIKNNSRSLTVYNGNVIDLGFLDWIQTDDLNIPAIFTELRNDKNILGVDISRFMTSPYQRKVAKCLVEIAKVGSVDSAQIGCIASQVVLIISLVFIISIVVIKFLFACYFRWFVSGRQGAFYMDNKTMVARDNEIEDWSENLETQGPIKTLNNRSSTFFNRANGKDIPLRTMSTQFDSSSSSKLVPGGSIYNFSNGNESRSSFLMLNNNGESTDPYKSNNTLTSTGPPDNSSTNYSYDAGAAASASGAVHEYVVPQPPIDYQPFNFPLAHSMCLVTAYSEGEDGLRTTLDSLATTDYPNSHKLLVVICDGLIKGSGEEFTTPDIAIGMMKDFTEPFEDTKPHSYVSVAAGSKRHNMAKVYAGFYKYDDNTVEPNKQQRVPMITIVKCGTPAEEGVSKPGNRGKRDSQIILMSFLQHVMFDERMSELEYEMFNGIWKITGIAPDFYEILLMVDADTKVYPDSLTHMIAEMVKDPEIMGLCGETKIANKRQSWVTAIQVFEYYISHHQSKAFESVFGGVTCLPGCFCMYRIKSPKGPDGFWVPILANPDIVERYSDNVVDTLHKKNLLLLGEDRFLTSLMLRCFPKRKQVFVPKAVCKTIVPDEFKVLLSQRRRWINSTVHNLMELVLVKDLCGVFCVSMQFVIFIELIGTLVLPAAISFTIYVIIYAIVSRPTPILSLVLLAIIMGLPGLLIIITASRWSYVVWMFIYLISLPIWNFVLPMYAYWKFDDFSWGDTRTIAGGDKGGHDDEEGQFDSTQIVMKRWREFERERR